MYSDFALVNILILQKPWKKESDRYNKPPMKSTASMYKLIVINNVGSCGLPCVKGRKIPKMRFSAIYSLLVSHNRSKDSLYESISRTWKKQRYVRWPLCHHTRDSRQNDSRMKANVSIFRAPLSTRHSRQLNSHRKGTTISLIRPGRNAGVHDRFAREKLLEPLAASSKWQIHVPKIGADGATCHNQ